LSNQEFQVPLLLCPNDNSAMQKVTREGVDIDICPTCKGVWLDRGELDKLLQAERAEADQQLKARDRFQEEVRSFERDPDRWKREHRYDDSEKRYRYDGDDDDDYRRGRRRRGFDLFDIFD
jgi:Zn-finger nucleic acid-binding protein